MKAMKTLLVNDWKIDDLVYFLPVACETGELPTMWRGTVEEIKRNSLRVKVQLEDSDNLVWIKPEYCFKSAEDLRAAVRAHLTQQAYMCDHPDEVSR